MSQGVEPAPKLCTKVPECVSGVKGIQNDVSKLFMRLFFITVMWSSVYVVAMATAFLTLYTRYRKLYLVQVYYSEVLYHLAIRTINMVGRCGVGQRGKIIKFIVNHHKLSYNTGK